MSDASPSSSSSSSNSRGPSIRGRGRRGRGLNRGGIPARGRGRGFGRGRNRGPPQGLQGSHAVFSGGGGGWATRQFRGQQYRFSCPSSGNIVRERVLLIGDVKYECKNTSVSYVVRKYRGDAVLWRVRVNELRVMIRNGIGHMELEETPDGTEALVLVSFSTSDRVRLRAADGVYIDGP